MKGVDYTCDIRKCICLVPPKQLFNVWQKDYNDMCSAMIYGEKPSFEHIVEQMRNLEKLFRQ